MKNDEFYAGRYESLMRKLLGIECRDPTKGADTAIYRETRDKYWDLINAISNPSIEEIKKKKEAFEKQLDIIEQYLRNASPKDVEVNNIKSLHELNHTIDNIWSSLKS